MVNYKPNTVESGTECKVLLIGVTGGTGQQVVQGFIDGFSGLSEDMRPQLYVMTRSPTKAASVALSEKFGCSLIQGDLDDPASLEKACQDMHILYCHGTSADAASADPVEVTRAESLARACLKAGIRHVVYNSAGGADRDSGIKHIEQKAAIEQIFRGVGLPLTNLRATLFMEELWKKYTRPSILKGTFRFAMPPAKTQQFICCRDMGFAAAACFLQPEKFQGKDIELAGDELTCPQVAEAFSASQKAKGLPPVEYAEGSAWIFWLISGELYKLIIWYQEKGYQANVTECRELFPAVGDVKGLLSFSDFLEHTEWSNPEKTYETLAI